jgi:putative RecB family exonuclease
MTDAPQRPALWLAGGSAVHEVTEVWDLLKVADPDHVWELDELTSVWDAAFDLQLAEAREREPNENAWRSSKTEPVEVWRRMGLQFVQSWIDWRERSPWKVWETPHGEPAIELEVSGFLPGCPVEIKAFVDRIFVDPVFGDALWDVDLKSGKKAPTSPSQFETYTALMEVKYGVRVANGVHFLNRKGGLGKPFDLSEVTPEAVGKVYGEAWAQIEKYAAAGEFPANGYPGECFPLCDVSAACAAQNGPLAPRYDPASLAYMARPGDEIPY